MCGIYISQRHRCLDVDIEDTCMYKSSLIFSVHSVLLELMGTWEQLDVNTIISQSNTNFTEAQSSHYQ